MKEQAVEQSRKPTVIASLALVSAIWNGFNHRQAVRENIEVQRDLQEQVESQAEVIEILTAEVARAQKALLTMGETLKSTAELVSLLKSQRLNDITSNDEKREESADADAEADIESEE